MRDAGAGAELAAVRVVPGSLVQAPDGSAQRAYNSKVLLVDYYRKDITIAAAV